MGKGDRKTRKGKIGIRSYGNVRPHSAKKTTGVAKPATKTTAKPAVKKAAAPAKKAPAKKAAG